MSKHISLASYELEAAARAEGYAHVCGADEAGAGPLMGPVYAAAVILPEGCVIEGLDDSKKLSEKKREALRLEASFKAAGERPILCFLHYPPLYQGYRCPELLELIDRYRAERCYYGHLHGPTHRRAFEGRRGETDYALVSADYLGFVPKKICD